MGSVKPEKDSLTKPVIVVLQFPAYNFSPAEMNQCQETGRAGCCWFFSLSFFLSLLLSPYRTCQAVRRLSPLSWDQDVVCRGWHALLQRPAEVWWQRACGVAVSYLNSKESKGCKGKCLEIRKLQISGGWWCMCVFLRPVSLIQWSGFLFPCTLCA